ncbi:helix-turn-helix domain-containing protein [Caulobacter sp. LARHSG274]
MRRAQENKTRFARRVIDLLDFFDEDHPTAKLTEIIHRFDWPQSSTSELLASLVDLGLLYNDRKARTFWLSPRAALLGTGPQPDFVREGRLVDLMDRLRAQTGLDVGLFAMVGLSVQICAWRPGKATFPGARAVEIHRGAVERLTQSAAGQLLLSSMPQPERGGIIHRINAEAPPEARVIPSDLQARMDGFRRQNHAFGPAGFGMKANMAAVLLPGLPEDRPMVVGLVFPQSDLIEPYALQQSLRDAIARSIGHCDAQSNEDKRQASTA